MTFGFIPIHPGEILKDEIEYRGISQRELARRMGLTYSVVSELLNGKRPLSIKNALLFEAALNIPADSLMRIQLKYDLQLAEQDQALQARLSATKAVAFA